MRKRDAVLEFTEKPKHEWKTFTIISYNDIQYNGTITLLEIVRLHGLAHKKMIIFVQSFTINLRKNRALLTGVHIPTNYPTDKYY